MSDQAREAGQTPAGFAYAPPDAAPVILYRDTHLLVVDKPAGLLSVPGKAAEHKDCLETRLRDRFPDTLLVHRLDMATSGVMIFARSRMAQRHLGLQFERRHAEKRYVAVVDGGFEKDEGIVDLPLIADWPRRPLQKVCHETGKKAVTVWHVVRRQSGSTRLHLFPRTGRSHQLRVHMAALGHPILGDRFYGSDRVMTSAPRLMLHAENLTIRHPEGGARVTFAAACPF